MKFLGPFWWQTWRTSWTVGGCLAFVTRRRRFVVEVRRERVR